MDMLALTAITSLAQSADEPYTFTTLGFGSGDGTASVARFNHPFAVTAPSRDRHFAPLKMEASHRKRKPTAKPMKTAHVYFFARLILGVWLMFTTDLQGASRIQFALTTYTVAESAGAVTLTVQRQDDPSTAVSVDYATADGTATNGLKYTAVSGTLAFGTSETNKTIVVPILNEGFVEGTKTFQVILSNPTVGAVLGTRTNAAVRITDNDFGIQFQFATYSVPEDAGAVLLSVVRGDDGTLPVTAGFATTDLTAINGLDYTGTTTTLSFAPEERLKLVSIPILNNSLNQPSRNFRVTLANPVGASLGSQKTATVTIVDNDQGFQFDSTSYSVAEDAGVVRIGVLRGTDDTNSIVTVDFATSDSTATNGLDYGGITNKLFFAPGERVKLVTAPILNDGVKEPTESFRVTLSNPSDGAVLGSRATATVPIVDNDPGIGIELASYSVWENAGAITITVQRGNDVALGPITADYATSNLTARAGQDYQAVSGTLAFEQNETVKTITIPILPDGLVTKNTSFRVILSNPTGGATLGRTSTSVSILDATGLGTYRTVAPPFDTALTIGRSGGLNILTWSGGGQLQRADRPTGPWQMLTNASSPAAVQSALPTTFYRVTRPRPVNVYVPSSYDGQTRLPVVILLHGYTQTGAESESYFQFQPLAEARGFFYCYPDSMIDLVGNPFWNATDGCCDFLNTRVDDSGYLRGLIEEIGSQFAVDRKRVYVIGHSNGGFMAYGMACQSAHLIAGIASLAGMTFLDPSRCQPSQPVNVLHIHGTADDTVPYSGSALSGSQGWPASMPAFPGALQTVQTWAGYNSSTSRVMDATPSLDLTTDVPGLDTVVTRYTNGPPGGAVELWTINGGGHVPTLSSQFSPRVIDWLLSHSKP
jgi:poly(3-hydroxybutyrate) depolymerase